MEKHAPKAVPKDIAELVPGIVKAVTRTHTSTQDIRYSRLGRQQTQNELANATAIVHAQLAVLRAPKSSLAPVRAAVKALEHYGNVVASLGDALSIDTPISKDEFRAFQSDLGAKRDDVEAALTDLVAKSNAAITRTDDADEYAEVAAPEEDGAQQDVALLSEFKPLANKLRKDAPALNARARTNEMPILFSGTKGTILRKFDEEGFDARIVSSGFILMDQIVLAVRSENLRLKKLSIREKEDLLMLKNLNKSKDKMTRTEQDKLVDQMKKTRPGFSRTTLLELMRTAEEQLKGDIPEDEFVAEMLEALKEKTGQKYHLVNEGGKFIAATDCTYYWIMDQRRLTQLTNLVGAVVSWKFPF